MGPIERYELFHVRIPFKGSFEHASHARHASDALLVCLHADGVEGWGEIQPRAYVTGETIETVKAEHAAAVFAAFAGRSIDSVEDAAAFADDAIADHEARLATFGGFELALLDLVGRATKTSAGAFLGPASIEALPAGVIIGFEVATDALAKHCALLRFKRRRHIKVKVGLDDDAERIRIVWEKLKLPIRLDANEAWTVEETIEKLNALDGVDIASIEQPIPAADLDGLVRIREAGHRVMVDEALIHLADAERIAAMGAADVFNVRLGKLGGMVRAKRIVEVARAHDLRVHLGTMVGETGVLTRATEVFATRVEGFDCLDGKGQNHHLLSQDVLVEPPAPFGVDPDDPGLGLSVAREKIREYAVES